MPIQATRDRWHDADCVAILGARIFFFEESYVLIIQIYIHKAANFPLIGVKMFAQFGEAARKTSERLAHRSGITFDAGLLSRELAKRRRNQNLYGHAVSPLVRHPYLITKSGP